MDLLNFERIYRIFKLHSERKLYHKDSISFQYFKYVIILLLNYIYNSMFHIYIYINKYSITSMCCIIFLKHLIIHWYTCWYARFPILCRNLTKFLQIISIICWCMRTITALHLQCPEQLQEIQQYYSLFSNVLYYCIDNRQHGLKPQNDQ
jgi:hypothetical protein